ncbi:uncharacterized protein F4822DRAFT_423067 [Hypoxylon trugodes]|uniref:uncharacterized protein n=1 Tax=Hypoxylon trugodes TaxID=326681 RepID=UPI00219420F6|nr:uncharacterized protein F4822DRAFT_423067 [Hypoxylon trugodes]KAI1382628.1 hypothetical protein F4822DRAFT_423067 [Hypoxylon trugodes]
MTIPNRALRTVRMNHTNISWVPVFSVKTSSTLQSDKETPRKRREGHKPRTTVPEDKETYHVLTIQTDPIHRRTMCALRERYYPPSLLRVSAHISLFRALPGSMLPVIKTDIAAAAAQTAPFDIRAVGPPVRLGRGGVGVSVSGLEPVEKLVKDFQNKWQDTLSRQDRAAFRGHYTLMNKVDDPEVVARCFEEVSREMEPNGCPGTALGLSLWRYDNGWWRHQEDFPFSGTGDKSS